MNQDWTRERWRKQYVREPLQERLWPVMARGLRELLNMLAEDDGTLVDDVDDPEEGLVTALGANAEEIDLVRAAVALLVRKGFLANDGRSIRIPDLPAAQATKASAGTDIGTTPEAPRKVGSSTERVRRYRARLRERLAAERLGSVASNEARVSEPTIDVSEPVSPPASETFPASRGYGKQDPSYNPDREKNIQIDLPLPPHARARDAHRASAKHVTLSESTEDDEDDGFFSMKHPAAIEQALRRPVSERAALILERPEFARALHPEQWPEVLSVAAALAEVTGLQAAYLGTYEDDEGVQAVVKLFAAGIPQTSLEFVARTVPRQTWWSANGKRLGLSSLTLEVVRRNLPGPDGRSRITSPGVAKVIASVQEEARRLASRSR